MTVCLTVSAQDYESRYFFWEVVELLRKAAFTIVIVVFAGTDSVDIVVATIISVVVVVGGARDEAGGAHPTGESRGSLSMLLLLID